MTQYRLMREFIEKQLANEKCGWTDRQREMLEGVCEYTKHVQDDWEAAIEISTNPGNPDPEPPPEGLRLWESNTP